MSEPPELPVLELVLGGRTYKRRPYSSRRDVDPATLEQLQAAWDAADRTPARSLIRAARKKAQLRPATADDSARRVKQKKADSQQQGIQRGAFFPNLPCERSSSRRFSDLAAWLLFPSALPAQSGMCKRGKTWRLPQMPATRTRPRRCALSCVLTQNTDPSISDRPAHPSTD